MNSENSGQISVALTRIERAVLKNIIYINNKIIFQCVIEGQNDKTPLWQLPQFEPINLLGEHPYIPSINSIGIVLLKNPESFDNGGYWIGSISNPVKTILPNIDPSIPKRENTYNIGNGQASVMVNAPGKQVQFNAGASGLTINHRSLSATAAGGESSLYADSNVAYLKTGKNKYGMSITPEKSSFIGMNDVMVKATNGKSSEEATAINKYATSKIEMKSGGKISSNSNSHSITGGTVSIKGISSKAFGGKNTIEMYAVDGKISMANATGNIVTQTLSPSGSVKIQACISPLVPFTSHEISTTKSVIQSGLTGMASVQEISPSEISMKAGSLSSMTMKPSGSIEMEGMTQIKISSQVKIEMAVGSNKISISPTGIEIDGNVKVNGKINATGDVVAGTISLMMHKHTIVPLVGPTTSVY